VHVVGFTEAEHAATAADVIESCKMARRSIQNAINGQPDMTQDSRVRERVEELVTDAKLLIEAIRSLAPAEIRDPLIDPSTLAKAVTSGLLDAPQLKNNRFARGDIFTTIDSRGACVVIDAASGNVIKEQDRIHKILN